jgi:adenylate cyclase class 1
MFEIISDHLMSKNNAERLDLAKKCFYFKINEPLSLAVSKESQARRPKVMALVNEWGWEPAYLKQLDKKASWKIETVLQESNRLAYEISNFHRFVTNFAQGIISTQKLLNPQEMVLLGRKIYTAFERRSGKIENINLGVSKDLSEEHLTIIEIVREKEESQWDVARTALKEDIPQIAFKHSASILELSSWLIYNGLYNKKTKFSIESSNSIFKKDKFSELFENLNNFLLNLPRQVQKKTLRTASHLNKVLLFINLGVDPIAEHPDSLDIIDKTFDPFCFGQDRKSMISLIEQVSINSWHELVVTRYLGPNCIAAWLEHFLSHSANPYKKDKPEFKSICLYNTKNNLFENRLEKLTAQLQQYFIGHAYAKSLRYILPFGTGFLMTQFQEQKPKITILDSQVSLIHSLSDPQEIYSPVIFDNYLADNSLLGELFSKQEPEKICLFYLRTGDKAVIYIIDEKGSIFIDRIPYRNPEQLVNNYGHFFINTRVAERNQNKKVDLSEIGLFFEVHQKQDGLRAFVPREKLLDPDLIPAFDIKVTAIFDVKCGLSYNIEANKLMFSTSEDGHAAYLNAAKHVLSQRPSKEKYECRINHLDLRVLEKDRKTPLQTNVYLQHKKTIESLLNISLDRLK